MMRILIDLQGAQNGSRHRGIGRYSLALAKGIARNRGIHEVFILLNGLFPDAIADIQQSFSGLLPSHHIIIFNAVGPVDELLKANTWRLRSAEMIREKIVNELNPDIHLISSLFEGACDNTITSVGQLFSKTKSVVVLYDLIPYLDPDKYIGWPPARDWYYRKIAAVKRADLLLAISNSAQGEAIEHLKVRSERTVNISSAADSSFSEASTSPQERSKVLVKFGITRKYLMHSSAFDERKNFEGLIKAFGLLSKKVRSDFQLVLVCKIDEAGRKILNAVAAEAGLNDGELVLTGFVSDKELICLYSECYLFVFPSFHEGFGLPALEAMSCGVPAIGSNNSSIPEVIGREDALFDAKSHQSIAQMIERVLTDVTFWKSLKEHAQIHSKKFSWDRCAQIAIEAFEKLCANEQNDNEIYYSSVENNFSDFIDGVNAIKTDLIPSENDLIETANAIANNEIIVSNLKTYADFNEPLKWRVEGPFDSTYSLALLNRETARGLNEQGHFVVLHSTEGPGDFPANPQFLLDNTDIAQMHERVSSYPHTLVDVVSRNLYPPRVQDMSSSLNLLHHYAWEESGFPQEWVNDFNTSLDGITCLSNHVEKILIDNGVDVPMTTSGCGVDHWERIIPDTIFRIEGKEFRFLHVSSCFPRKGVDLLLDAYGKAFDKTDNVTLVIKTFENPHNEIYTLLAERQTKNSNYPDVNIIVGDLTDSELKALYQQCHVLVAPSKAEGFGLPMAEAMLSGLPVITTGWGGQLDFCNDENSWIVDYEFEHAETHFGLFSSVWAKINVVDLADALRKVKKMPKQALLDRALIGRTQLLQNFKWKDVVSRAVGAANKWKSESTRKPDVRVGWVTTWNTKCGIATYSEHLINSVAESNIVVLAPSAPKSSQLDIDDLGCVRCWNQGKDNNNFPELMKNIHELSLNTIIVQFNYGFFNFSDFSEFLKQLHREGRMIVVVMHSTFDPLGAILNWRISELKSALSLCHRILVHSVPDLNRLKTTGLIENVALFPHGVLNYPELGIAIHSAEKLPLVATYGFCLPHKGLSELIEAVGILRRRGQDVLLKLVTAEYPDPISTKLINELKKLVKTLNIDDLVEIHTDFLSDSASLSLLNDADLLVFAYQQTGESASGAVRYGLATKRPIAVTPLGIFEDIGNAAFKFKGVSPLDIADGISEFLQEIKTDSQHAQFIKAAAKKWREQFDYAAVGQRLMNICTGLIRKYPRRTYRYYGTSPNIGTVVGDVQGKKLYSTGVAGNLISGPYVDLPAGKFNVIIHGSLKTNDSGAHYDITTGNGNNVHAIADLNEVGENIVLVNMHVMLEVPCNDFEIRVWITDQTEISISLIEIIPT